MKNLLFVVILTAGSYTLLKSQAHHVNVSPDLTGEALLTELVRSYKTATVLDYSVARDTLFSRVDAVGDSLECIYTGLKLYIKPGQDPTEAVYLGGIPNGINTEHSWPQGKGAVGQAQSDMHHLYPSRIKTNSDRGDHPFGEIPDSQTSTWYYKNTERSSPPTSGRDAYSEGIVGRFEPREAVKGNIARSLFYFYTMYRSEANAADAGFFGVQKADLCEWHYQDPVDEREWMRNQKIATYQGGKLNPFILDCSLVSRAYCNNIDQACEALVLSNVVDTEIRDTEQGLVYPNPGQGTFFIKYTSMNTGLYYISVRDITGKMMINGEYEFVIGQNVVEIDMGKQNNGLYFIGIRHVADGKSFYLPYMYHE